MNDINLDAQKIAQKLKIDDRVEKMQETEAFLTIKDHKQGFQIHYPFINKSIKIRHWKNKQIITGYYK